MPLPCSRQSTSRRAIPPRLTPSGMAPLIRLWPPAARLRACSLSSDNMQGHINARQPLNYDWPIMPSWIRLVKPTEGTNGAGMGAAWLWQGAPGSRLDAGVMCEMRRFLRPSAPQVRVLGGARFDAAGRCGDEWREFGSHCFLLPRRATSFMAANMQLRCVLIWRRN